MTATATKAAAKKPQPRRNAKPAKRAQAPKPLTPDGDDYALLSLARETEHWPEIMEFIRAKVHALTSPRMPAGKERDAVPPFGLRISTEGFAMQAMPIAWFARLMDDGDSFAAAPGNLGKLR
jgi:hypothetical protein